MINERPDAILNIVDGTNLERNLYLTTQLTELGIPVVVAINMMDVVKKKGDLIRIEELSRELGCKVVEISALKGTGVMEAAEEAVTAAQSTKTVPMHSFNGAVEHAIAILKKRRCTICLPSNNAGMPLKFLSAMKKCWRSSNWILRCWNILKPTSKPQKKRWTTMPRASLPMSGMYT